MTRTPFLFAAHELRRLDGQRHHLQLVAASAPIPAALVMPAKS